MPERTTLDPRPATVEMGHYTTVVLAMAVDSLRAGKRLRWDAAARQAAP